MVKRKTIKKSKRNLSKRSKRTKENKRTKKSKRNLSKRSNRSKRTNLKNFCSNELNNKISINMKEFKKGNKKIKSPLQAIAIAYSQIKKKHPECSKTLERKSKK
jgi:hypothetical protein